MRKPVHILLVSDSPMQHAKTAMLAMVSTADRYQVDGQWRRVNLDEWIDRQPVDAINAFGRHQIERGDTLVAERIDGSIIAHVHVNSINMADTSTLTAADIERLGYSTRLEFLQDWGEAYAGKVWLLGIERVTPQVKTTANFQ